LRNGYLDLVFLIPSKDVAQDMKILLIIALSFGFGVLALAGQTDPTDPQLIEKLNALDRSFDEAFNRNDATALAALFTEDAVLVRPQGPLYGRRAIEQWYSGVFQKWRCSDHFGQRDQYSPHSIGTTGNEVWCTGQFGLTIEEQKGPFIIKETGYWSSIVVLDGNDWKARMLSYSATN
jgi:ketosteroid isomerase-like protein